MEASLVPAGDKVVLQEGETARITQELGGHYTVLVNGNLFRIDHHNGDALGREVEERTVRSPGEEPRDDEKLESEIWSQLRTCYDPEIPVNIVDLGLIYDCALAPEPLGDGGRRVDVKMTLTAPGCGMGPVLQQDVQNRLLCIEEISEANVELVWEPQWNQGMMSEAAQLQLGLM